VAVELWIVVGEGLWCGGGEVLQCYRAGGTGISGKVMQEDKGDLDNKNF
jgi:hypothetical protein